MKKLLHFLTAAAIAVAPAAVAQNLSVEGVEGEFKTFQDAFNAIETEGTINVLQDFTAQLLQRKPTEQTRTRLCLWAQRKSQSMAMVTLLISPHSTCLISWTPQAPLT